MILRCERFLVSCDECLVATVDVEKSFAPTVDLVDARAINSQLTELGWQVQPLPKNVVKTYCPNCRHE